MSCGFGGFVNLTERLHEASKLWWIVVLVGFADVLGMVFGWYYYWDVGQFNPDSRFFEAYYWWPLVSDSPNAVLLFFVPFVLYAINGWRNKWLDAAAVITNVYVGCWTTMLFLSYSQEMGTWDWGSTNNVLFFSHLGMPAQALFFLHRMRNDHFSLPQWLWLIGAGALYVFVDYWGPELHPAPSLDDGILTAASPWLMVVALLALALFTSRGQPGNSTQ